MNRIRTNSLLVRIAFLAAISCASILHSYGTDVIAHVKIEGAAKQKTDQTGMPISVVLWLTPTSGTIPEVRAVQPVTHYRLVQHNKQFSPHLLVVPVGSNVEFPNRDPFFHNVFSLFNGKRFDLGLYESGTSRMVKFDQEGVSYIFCNIHPQMGAVVIALRTPYFAISTPEGVVTIHDVPPGTYDFAAWAEGANPEELKSLARRVHVGSGEDDLGLLHIQADLQAMKHKNKFGEDYTPTENSPY